MSTTGEPSAVLMSCKRHLGGVTVYRTDDPAGTFSEHAAVARWKMPAAYSSPVLWSLLASKSEAVTIDKTPPAELAVGRPYRIYGWGRDATFPVTRGPVFNSDDIARLHPGEVLIEDLSAPKDAPELTRVSMDRFKQLACE
jgi:hypothetical protein